VNRTASAARMRDRKGGPASDEPEEDEPRKERVSSFALAVAMREQKEKARQVQLLRFVLRCLCALFLILASSGLTRLVSARSLRQSDLRNAALRAETFVSCFRIGDQEKMDAGFRTRLGSTLLSVCAACSMYRRSVARCALRYSCLPYPAGSILISHNAGSILISHNVLIEWF
jgi:hypothetical protein